MLNESMELYENRVGTYRGLGITYILLFSSISPQVGTSIVSIKACEAGKLVRTKTEAEVNVHRNEEACNTVVNKFLQWFT